MKQKAPACTGRGFFLEVDWRGLHHAVSALPVAYGFTVSDSTTMSST